jgi:ribosomal protein L11 methyltransferase
MNYISFYFETTNADLSGQLVALLSEQGFEGFEETDQYLKAFVKEDIFDETSFKMIETLYPTLTLRKKVVENINWNKQWEENFTPIMVDDFVAVRAAFHQPISKTQHEIVITPKMSFGTGHHATTYLMIEQMQHLDFSGKTVLDFGTGTGILAILAEKLGAAKILAIDNDEWSITNANENIAQNNCDKIVVRQHNTIPGGEKYDIILANINLNVITDNLPAIFSVTGVGCHVLFSGFLTTDEMALQADVKAVGLKSVVTVQKGNWIVISAVK